MRISAPSREISFENHMPEIHMSEIYCGPRNAVSHRNGKNSKKSRM